MAAKLTPEQRDALKAHSGHAVPVEDDESKETYYLVTAPSYLHMQGLIGQHDQQCREQLRQLVEEGINSPGVPADEALARLRATAKELSKTNA